MTATLQRYQSDPRPKSSEGAFQMLDWLVYGGIGWGLACDYNLNSTSTNQEQACGPRFTPSIVAERNTGIQRTLLYGVGDVRYYPTLSRVDLVDTTAASSMSGKSSVTSSSGFRRRAPAARNIPALQQTC